MRESEYHGIGETRSLSLERGIGLTGYRTRGSLQAFRSPLSSDDCRLRSGQWQRLGRREDRHSDQNREKATRSREPRSEGQRKRRERA
eukprot:768494-Hanusia_phi.AAC.4